jgi:hypothetical protein
MTLTQIEREAYDAYVKHGTQQKAAESLGIPRRSFRRYFDSAKAKTLSTPIGFKTTKVTTDKFDQVTSKTHKLAPEIDHKKRTGKVMKTSTLYGADGSVVGEWVMRQPQQESQDEFMAALEKNFITNVRERTLGPAPLDEYTSKTELAVFLSVDDHIGVRLTKQMNGQDYGLRRAVEVMTAAFTKLLDRTPVTRNCLYVNLGDKLHSNDHMDVTPGHKHTLHSDSDFDTVADAVVALEINRVLCLLEVYQNVKVVGVRGNHDIDPTGWLYRCLALAFKNEPRVTVQFYADGLGTEIWGETLLSFHHGDKMKPDAMAGAVADRNREMYGATSMRYLHTGHIHHDEARDVWGGFKWESHRTAAPQDTFSRGNGYTTRQVMKSIVYDRYEGEVGRYQVKL